jgi:hypothetical protein
MVAWLEDADDAPSDVEVWKVEKGLYGFADLDMWLKNDGKGLELNELKGKKGRKEKERSLTKETTGKVSHKGKGKEKDKGKGKVKEKSSQKEK